MPRHLIAILHDSLMAAASVGLALFLRLGEDVFLQKEMWLQSTLIFTIIAVPIFISTRLYRGLWRYASMEDLITLARAVTLSVLVFTAFLFLLTRLDGYPRSTIVIHWMVLIFLLGTPRILYRMLKDRVLHFEFRPAKKDTRTPVLLVGLNSNAELFIRETARRSTTPYRVEGVIDSNKNSGRYIHNIPIFGTLDELPAILNNFELRGARPKQLVVTEESPNVTQLRKLLSVAEANNIAVAKLPNLNNLKLDIDRVEIRPIVVEDLLGRSERRPNLGRRKTLLEGKKIIVTGAGGTIGSELCRQIAEFNPAHITVIDACEYNLYAIDQELAKNFSAVARRAMLADVRNVERLESIWKETSPHMVFHAAALKHVPLVEENPIEAMHTNIIGTRNVADLCDAYQVEKMVLISTDKAVHPSSLMGATKRAAEKYIQWKQTRATHTQYNAVRFGNVLGSSGSVIPLFKKQLEQGGPITVTDPNVTRYFMTVHEAVELVLQASTLEKHTEESALYVLEMGEPIKISELARQMIKMSGMEPEKDIQIIYTGLRAGEKLTEELFYAEEAPEKTIYSDILRAKPTRDINPSIPDLIETLRNICLAQNTPRALELLKQLVPEYK